MFDYFNVRQTQIVRFNHEKKTVERRINRTRKFFYFISIYSYFDNCRIQTSVELKHIFTPFYGFFRFIHCSTITVEFEINRTKSASRLTSINYSQTYSGEFTICRTKTKLFFSSNYSMFDNCSFHIEFNPSRISQLLILVELLFFDSNCRRMSSRT